MAKLYPLYGRGQGEFLVLPPPIPFANAPTSGQTEYAVGQVVYTGTSGSYSFYVYSGAGVWVEFVSGSGGDVLSVTGTANQISASPTTGSVVLSLIGPYTPSTYTAHGVLIGEGTSSIVATAAGTAGQVLTSGGASANPTWTTATFPSTAVAGSLIAATATNVIGQIADVAVGQVLASGGVGAIPAYTGSPSVSGSLTAATTITATLGAITATNGNLVLGTAGNKINIATGSNASCGIGTLSSGVLAVTTTAADVSSLGFAQYTVPEASPGILSVVCTSNTITITSTDLTDSTSTVHWFLIN